MLTFAPQRLPMCHCQELAEYEQEPAAVLLQEDELRRDGFGPNPKFRAIFAEQDGQPAGYSLFFPSYSTWTGSGLRLEDLFVREQFRGHRVGKAGGFLLTA